MRAGYQDARAHSCTILGPATFREVMPFCYWLIAPKFSPDAISRN
jgi:hypothetical protein